MQHGINVVKIFFSMYLKLILPGVHTHVLVVIIHFLKPVHERSSVKIFSMHACLVARETLVFDGKLRVC